MFKGIEFIEDVDLKRWSTVKIGGFAKYIVFPKNHLEIEKIIKICKKNNKKYYILGNGSNILFDDAGFDGVLINLKYFQKIKVCATQKVYVGAGVKLFSLNLKLKDFGFSGLEWSYGIPATLGGLIVMNGGSFGHEICEFVDRVLVFDGKKLKVLKREEIDFAYRHSSLLGQYIVLGAWLKLEKESSCEIGKRLDNFFERKKASQPYELPSLGSVFKQIHNGEEIIYPAKMIDKMGLKGVTIGRAQISEKHAGFIVNVGNATSEDFLKLVNLVEKEFFKLGLHVDREIIYLR